MPVVLESNVYLQRNDTSRNILALLQTLLGVRVVPLAIQKRLIVCATLGSNVLGGRHQDGRSGDGRIHCIFPHRCSCCSCCNCWSLFVCRSHHLLPSCFSSLVLSLRFCSLFVRVSEPRTTGYGESPLSPWLLPALSCLSPTRLEALATLNMIFSVTHSNCLPRSTLIVILHGVVSPTLNVNPTLFVIPCMFVGEL